MNKLFATSVSAMNYLFLKQTFTERMNEYVISELEIFLFDLINEWNSEVEEIVYTEFLEGEYTEGLKIEQVESLLKKSLEVICGGDDFSNRILEKYLELAKKIMEEN